MQFAFAQLPPHDLRSFARLTAGGFERFAHDEFGATLIVAPLASRFRVYGAFERIASSDPKGEAESVRRLTGGGAFDVDERTLYVALRLNSASALVPARPEQALNRYVRPMLAALRAVGVRATYTGRDWFGSPSGPFGGATVGHERLTRYMVLEFFLRLEQPLETRGRPTYRGEQPRSAFEAAGRPFTLAALAVATRDAYANAYGAPVDLRPDDVALGLPLSTAPERPWDASELHAIGDVGVRCDAGRWRIGGQLMASADVIKACERNLAALESGAESTSIRNAVLAPFAEPDEESFLFGVPSPETLAALACQLQNRA